MQRLTLEVDVRSGVGKEAAKKARAQGIVPGVIYGRGFDPVAVSVPEKALEGALHTQAGMNVLLDLTIRDNDNRRNEIAMVHGFQRDVLRRGFRHVDFRRINLNEKLHARVPVVLVGQARGITEGGILEQTLREVEVECLPTDIPEHFELNVTNMIIGNTLHVSDLAIPEAVRLLTHETETIAALVAAPQTVSEESATPGAAPGEPAQPEVIEKGKKEAEG
jgi:large subunit ribosomal protein L25